MKKREIRLGRPPFWLGVLLALGAVVLAGTAPPAAARRETARRLAVTHLLPPPGFSHAAAVSINDSGDVAGAAFNLDESGQDGANEQAVVWQGSRPRLLPLPGWASDSFANAINRRGLVAGGADLIESGELAYEGAAFWRGKRLLSSAGATQAVQGSFARGLNDRGEGAGQIINQEGFRHAALFRRDGRVVDLGTLPGFTRSTARRISNLGQIVGTSFNVDANRQDVERHAVLWENGKMLRLPEWPGAQESAALDVNDWGAISGWIIGQDGVQVPVVWLGNRIFDLGGLEPGDTYGNAVAINNRGQVLIDSARAVGPDLSETQLVLWEGGKRTNLNALLPAELGIVSLAGEDLNNRGEIAASARVDVNDAFFAFGVKLRLH
jgi:probable HAF family extracellular repeat protein